MANNDSNGSRSANPVDNPLPHVLPEGQNAAPLEVMGSTASDKVVVIMVGLPATGKTHIAKRICRFLSFFHDIPAQIFNVGDYRRQLCGPQMPADFYDPDNKEGSAARTMACDAALADLVEVRHFVENKNHMNALMIDGNIVFIKTMMFR
jgi:hypothetical protein